MSARYSTSPSLHLLIGRSLIYRALHALLCLLTLCALLRLAQRGYPWLALLLLTPVCFCWYRLAQQNFVGTVIRWHCGEWLLQEGGRSRAIAILPRSTCLRSVIYLAWADKVSQHRESVFLFADSAAAQQLRQLRVRLTLER